MRYKCLKIIHKSYYSIVPKSKIYFKILKEKFIDFEISLLEYKRVI